VVVGATNRECGALVRDRAGDGTPGGPAWPAVVFRDSDIEVIVSGVGKANAAGATARVLEPALHAGVVSIGVAGALPGSGLAIGDVVIGVRMVLADEGSENPDGFMDLGAMGFGPMPDGSVGADAHAGVVAALGRALPASRTGVIATVSVCSGTDARAAAIGARTGAIAEAMEGAAVALAALRIGGPGFPVVEVRAISNTTGDRSRQRWDLEAGFSGLGRIGVVL
jgi:futalosine hydrolase